MKLTETEQHELSMIQRFGRTTNKRAVNGLVTKRVVTIDYEQEIFSTAWTRGTNAYFCTIRTSDR
jgi:hypothetical protein